MTQSIGEYSDAELISLFDDPAGKERAFGILVHRYKEKLYWHIRKILIDHDDTDDALQETLVKVWLHLGEFRGDSSIFTWIYRVATNEALGHLRKKSRRTLFSLDSPENMLAEKLESDSYFSGDALQMNLQKAILQLPEKQRIIFNMKYYDDMKYEDMAEILEVSVGALKASYHHAVKKIEKIISGA